MFSTSPSDPNCQKWFILIKDAAFSYLVSRDRWHHVISMFELWGFLRWTSVVVVVFSCYGILLFWCCLWLQVDHVTRLLVSDSLITWSTDRSSRCDQEFCSNRNKMNEPMCRWHQTAEGPDWRMAVRWSPGDLTPANGLFVYKYIM